MTDTTTNPKRSTAEIVLEAIQDLHAREQIVTREILSELTGLKLTTIDDRLGHLVDTGKIRRVQRGVFVPLEQHRPARPISRTLCPDGTTVLEVGDTVMILTPRESRMLGDGLTMSSREIAELTGSTHDNVLKTVRRLISEGVVLGNETPYIHPQNGQTYMEFRMSFRDTMVVVSGYSAELRARIIDRWRRSFRVREGLVSRVPKRAIGEMYARAEQAEAHPEFSEALKGKSEVTGRAPSVLCATAQPPILPMPLTHGQSSTRPASSQISKARSG